MAQLTLNINGQQINADVAEGTSLLWVIREHLGLTGTKYGCGVGQCGSCTVHINGNPIKSCTVTAEGVAEGQAITTIEGLAKDGQHPLQQAWVAAQVPQCGYCQSGQIMQAAALLKKNGNPTREEIIKHMNGNLCRCGTYLRILKAIQIAAGSESLMTSTEG
ncbi:MAG: (2Fe-2S)-binding protein [Bacteroidota bacterium]